MKKINININNDSRVPKYKQIVDFFIYNIANGEIPVQEKLPSINELSEYLLLSRDTIEKAYRILKERKLITSAKGKGFYTAKTDLISKLNVLFLVNKPSNYKMEIYKSLVKTIGVDGHVNLSIYHCDEDLFIRSLEKNIGGYDYYVIMPHFRDQHSKHLSASESVLKTIEKIPKNKLIMLDNAKLKIKGEYGSVYQDFKNDIYEALQEAHNKLGHYEKIILVFPEEAAYPYPNRILRGFKKFCQESQFNYEILNEIYEDMELESKDAYITIRERDLVNLIQQIQSKNLQLAKDIGIISYNETPLKELLGITVISTDFEAMGQSAGYMILKNKKENVKNVFKYLERDSV